MTASFTDAENITSYPFVVSSSPDNADALRTKRQRAERNPYKEEEISLNAGHEHSGSRRGLRQAGRSCPDDRNWIPDYPLLWFQEEVNTGLLAQSSISLVPAPMSSIPEDKQDGGFSELIQTTQCMEMDTLREVAPVDYTSESDDSMLVIINKNEVPVCSTDFPPTKHENRRKWFKRRKQDASIASTDPLEKSGDVLPGTTTPIGPYPSGMREQHPTSSPKRHFSFSPIKTIFPSKSTAQLHRPLFANSSPSLPKFPLGNKKFFRSANSLTVSSLPRLPGSQKRDPLSPRSPSPPASKSNTSVDSMDATLANIISFKGSSSPDAGSPQRQAILGRTGGRGRRQREGVPTGPKSFLDDKLVGALDSELLGGGGEGSKVEGLKDVEGRGQALLFEGPHLQQLSEFEQPASSPWSEGRDLNPAGTSQLPASNQTTISARSATFFSSNNMTISGGSFCLNVMTGPDPSVSNFTASNYADPAVVGRNPQETQTLSARQPALTVSDKLLGIGSCGTVVYRGSFQGRPVAVKKLLRDFVTLAEREVSILQEADNHPNVIQYYYQEARDNCLFIAIELCSASLADIIEKPDRDQWRDIVLNFDSKKALEEITSGLDHLHNLNVVHRDIKPQNVLVSTPQRTTSRNGKGRVGYRMLISDFGLCRKLDDDQTSFLPTTHGVSAAGTRGWQAPEILRIKVERSFIGENLAVKDCVDSTMQPSSKNTPLAHRKLTKSMDIFPLGCLFYYTLTRGRHPYGREFEREVNIWRDTNDLSGVEMLGEEGLKAKDLIMKMLDPEPRQRPNTTTCLEHPYFVNS